jgi:hypothetical protein
MKQEESPVRICLRVMSLLFAALLLPSGSGQAQERPTPAEKAFFDSANRERESRGFAPLHWDAALARSARVHAQMMAQRNTLSHQFPGELDLSTRARKAGAGFGEIAENVAEGPSTRQIHAQWMNSPPHRRNLLDPDLDSIGVGVAERNGLLFAVEDFSHGVPNLSLEEQERQVGALLKARGLQLLYPPDDARKSCATTKGFEGKRRPLYVMRFETADLTDMPANLLRAIKTGRYHSAAVGACATGDASAFTHFRIAVLLF